MDINPVSVQDPVQVPSVPTQSAGAPAGPSGGQILVKTLAGKTEPFDYRADLTIAELKNCIGSRTQVPADQQRLIHQGKQLEDANTLGDYNIQAGSTIHLVLRVKGGL